MTEKINPGDVIAVGDIHGRADLLHALLDYVEGSDSILIFLGDLIDRGPRSVECLATVKHLCENPGARGLSAAHCLLGNHEASLLRALKCGPGSYAEIDWVSVGGNTMDLPLMARYESWLRTLPFVIMDEDTIFAHAGLVPGQDPNDTIRDGRYESLYWIREPFLTIGPKLKAWTSEYNRVIHGHTPVWDNFGGIQTWPDVSASFDRIGIDTGAYWTGVLTAFNSTQNTYFSINGKSDADLQDAAYSRLERIDSSLSVRISAGDLGRADDEQWSDRNGDVCFSKFLVCGDQVTQS
jgi:serine/threonine protein phosphatase 1